jgi:hypothetical protein
MRASAVVETHEAGALALRMAKHFGHKVDVRVENGVTRVAIPAGRFELEPSDGTLVVRAEADDDAGLARVEEVAGSHLVRFARETELELAWSRPLEDRAAAWISSHRNARHLLRARDWLRDLRPDAGEALVLAALLHDADRELGGVPLDEQVAAWDDAEALRAHAERSAALAAEWLRTEGAHDRLVTEVRELVRLHEVGGSEGADLVQAADSLSFLEVNPAARWVSEGRASAEAAERKLGWMYDRIRVEEARRLAAPLLERAVGELVANRSTDQDSALAPRVRHANEGRAHGNTR